MRPASHGQAGRMVTRAPSGSRAAALSRGWARNMASRGGTQPAGRGKPLAGAGHAPGCLFDHYGRGTDWRAHQRKAAAVELEALAGLNHDVVIVAVLGDPERTGEAPDGKPLAIADIEDLTGAQLARDRIEARVHRGLHLHEAGACYFMGRAALGL